MILQAVMATHQIRGHCKRCGEQRLFVKQGTNHVLHLLLCIPTGGIWLIAWALAAFFNSLEPYRCALCGQAKRR